MKSKVSVTKRSTNKYSIVLHNLSKPYQLKFIKNYKISGFHMFISDFFLDFSSLSGKTYS